MNLRHQVFITEMLRHGDKEKAYSTAYPAAKGRSLTTAANRLLANPEIAKPIEESYQRIRAEAEQELKERSKKEILTTDRIMELLTSMAEGEYETIRHIRTKDGIEKVNEKPAHWHVLKAIDTYCCLKGEYATAAKKATEEPPKLNRFNVLIGDVQVDEYFEKKGGLDETYFDEGQKRNGIDPFDSNTSTHFFELQKERTENRDKKKAANSTPEYRRQEQVALEEYKNRPANDTYLPFKRVLDMVWEIYMYSRTQEDLQKYKALQKMIGLQYLPHRHRWEAELEAGWEFHPYKSDYIRKSAKPVTIPLGNTEGSRLGKVG